ncbi:Dihydrolipoyllysine-residue acetyltransferase [Nakaseomyces glabratus]|uniref:Acetyltransferase component of pyruvate dehydrogenase complex n=1 Tax=Candida glabrata TaxID=5478 RepID=A0A0W0DF74_CANGB|nr:Dihydrolipoyllysine-residue acetyltransferase [Nakaseomyces glabratus]KTB09042.1 Dihydrolipoyllysine-residue acetyltransferase [Nakaseomyces glabratus]KTB10440.1 Dihydrolipoyllysine-residue acetyltransferase [Nakaseomyces glabratus]KTB19769.1 Dihydrolipoyllysine-residue acetyltransferase [Nakaseomyces glabratus]
MSALLRALPQVSRTALRGRLVTPMTLRLYASFPPHTVIGMPALSPTMSQGNLAVWSKKEGDSLAPGDVLAEIETDKAQMDFEFQDEGYLAKILVPAGTKDVAVSRPIAVYVEDEADVAAFKDFTVEDAGGSQSSSAPAAEEQKEEPKKEEVKEEKSEKKAAKSNSTPSSVASGDRIIASPLAKTIALEKGIALKSVKGTGPRGRITKADVEKYLESAPKSTSTATPSATPSTTGGASYEDMEITNMRQIIGDRLLQSRQSIPSYIVSSDISVSKLLKLRKSLNATAKDQYKLSINDILIKAVTVAARRVPDANSYWLQNEGIIRQFKNVDVSVAVATPTGLLTPIVKNAESKGLIEISKEVKELASRAKINKLVPEEFQGGTICISNLGMNPAVSMFTSIINPPQSTILAIGTVKRVAVEDAGAENGIAFDDQVTITGTFDHRTIDGAKGADFMRELKTVIENPLQLLL